MLSGTPPTHTPMVTHGGGGVGQWIAWCHLWAEDVGRWVNLICMMGEVDTARPTCADLGACSGPRLVYEDMQIWTLEAEKIVRISSENIRI